MDFLSFQKTDFDNQEILTILKLFEICFFAYMKDW